jgi:hypothetical protein
LLEAAIAATHAGGKDEKGGRHHPSLYTTTHHGAKFEGYVIERRTPNAERRAPMAEAV